MREHHYEVDPAQRAIKTAGEWATLTPRSWDIFAYLYDRAGELVRAETLLGLFWQGSSGDQTYVRKAIVEIRRALGDDARSPRFIKTVAKQGYVLVAREPNDQSVPEVTTLAVLPFLTNSGAADEEAFADGLTEEVLSSLAQGLGPLVVARTSANQFRHKHMNLDAVGRSLGASHVLEGSIRRAGKARRVTARLIDVSSGVHIWSQTYERSVADDFRVQDEITGEIASAVCGLVARPHRGASARIRTVYVSKRFTAPNEFRKIVEAMSRNGQPE